MYRSNPSALPDPCDPTTGALVDKWLRGLRACGCSDQYLEYAARTLGRASNRGWHGDSNEASMVVQAFITWAVGVMDESPSEV